MMSEEPLKAVQAAEEHDERQMPRYRCHKIVHALEIGSVMDGKDEVSARHIVPRNVKYAPIQVSQAYIDKHHPEPGGYYIVYGDGYCSFSPKAAFEEGYTLIP